MGESRGGSNSGRGEKASHRQNGTTAGGSVFGALAGGLHLIARGHDIGHSQITELGVGNRYELTFESGEKLALMASATNTRAPKLGTQPGLIKSETPKMPAGD